MAKRPLDSSGFLSDVGTMIFLSISVFLRIFGYISVAAAAASSCSSPQVLNLPLRDIQVVPDIEDSYMRGIALKAGNPAQSLVVLPWA